MSERERWIVYPLLFLALGAALRDKIIKTTESQRIKCQGLAVFDSNDQPLLVLGGEQFPEIHPQPHNLIRLDEVQSRVITSGTILGDKFVTNSDRIGRLEANEVVAGNYVLTDGKNSFRIDGKYTVPLFYMLRTLQQSMARPPTQTTTPAGEAASAAADATKPVPTDPPKDLGTQDAGEPVAEPVAEKGTPANNPTTGPTAEPTAP